jgi:hypothetical protein
MSKQTRFEKNKSASIKLLSTAALETSRQEPSQYHGVALLLSNLRAELYENSEEYCVVKTELIDQIDEAIDRLFR